MAKSIQPATKRSGKAGTATKQTGATKNRSDTYFPWSESVNLILIRAVVHDKPYRKTCGKLAAWQAIANHVFETVKAKSCGTDIPKLLGRSASGKAKSLRKAYAAKRVLAKRETSVVSKAGSALEAALEEYLLDWLQHKAQTQANANARNKKRKNMMESAMVGLKIKAWYDMGETDENESSGSRKCGAPAATSDKGVKCKCTTKKPRLPRVPRKKLILKSKLAQ
ncbi:hypothetical protein GGF32_002808 [Allomyces javanicus]|nr:hypothetical protein GGF32_002808 [Allomyces javanicus]